MDSNEKQNKIAAQNFINGKWVDGSLGTLDMVNPSYDTVFAKIARGGKADIHAAVEAARTAFEGEWGRVPAVERGRLLQRASAFLLDHAEELARIECADTGKPLKQARADAGLLARYFEFYAGAADKLHGETIPYQFGYTVYTIREPFGVTGHIIPWNYPLQMTGRTLAPALAAGNAVVIKPSEDACLSVVRVFELLEQVGFPPGSINMVTGLGHEAGAALAAHPGVDHLSFTGSPEVGTSVMKEMAERRRPLVLELGGKSPQVVFDDADLDAAVPVIMNAILQNAGQTCSAGSRLLVHEDIYDEVVSRLSERFGGLVVGVAEGDPDVGPLISRKQLDRVREFVDQAISDGAVVLAQAKVDGGGDGSLDGGGVSVGDGELRSSDMEDSGVVRNSDLSSGRTSVDLDTGEVVNSDGRSSREISCVQGGYFFPPMLLGGVESDSFIAQNEVFGPVLVVMTFREESDAERMANDTRYGLVAGVWTKDVGRAHRMMRNIKAGQIFINGYGAGGGVELPFGGVKDSGFGREKGFDALYHFTTLKTVIVNHG